ncbi:glycoside hydrolase [Stereum hirsutum FP-91666 SS1]|uniref:glycoside hydrolase n=1 Tax=Stereum hirsutum (strain FP-91666) TaxID=721885 RepID=UPI000444A15A|nr:glycoside hydrolase [Stereum hirsutum FP-91666 SS1]EIM82341.1 glycoside hydrolase [Stereum hirsutum FP-91666 SS1]
MPRIPSVSPATGQPVPPHYIHTTDGQFVDSSGRTLLLRGVNLSGSSKAPVGEPSYVLDGFWEDAEGKGKSFVGRPLNLEDGTADVHLARLRGWGFNVLRYPVLWEALEHEGPGKYDYEFMDYTVRVLRKCKQYGFKIFMDPHQDVWSRFSGGSGAPYWTLLACGINPRNFTATQAAIIHSEYPSAQSPDPASVPAMIWSTNYGRLANQTLFTLFYAGRDFAPKCIIDGVNIQDYLQSHYIAAFGQLAERIREAGDLMDECVIGWDTLNEPSEGLVGYADLNAYPQHQTSQLKKGPTPTPAQSLRLGMGKAQEVDHWTFGTFGPSKDGTVTIDPKGRTIWSAPETEEGGVHPRYGWRRDGGWTLGVCVWALHGIWDVETGYVMLPEYFRSVPCLEGDEPREVEFIADYWRPHWSAYAKMVKSIQPEAIHFVAPPVFAQPPPLDELELAGRCAYSTHYYDGLTLITRHWNWFNADALGVLRGKYTSVLQSLKIGERAIRKSLQEQLGILKSDALILGAYPTMIGEIGIPYDMDGKRAYGYTDNGRYKGDYGRQERALDASLNAADGANALSYAVWTYCADGGHKWGDGWNMEDLSLWSPDDLRPRRTMMGNGTGNGEGEGEGQDPSGSRLQFGNMDDKSSTLLLKHNNNNVNNHKLGPQRRSFLAAAAGMHAPPTALGSALSLSSLPVTDENENANGNGHQRAESEDETLMNADRWDNSLESFDFLTDGARAYKAFSRPYPMAAVGIPIDMAFDVGKAEFRMTIRVRPEDRPVCVGVGGDEGEGKVEVPPTEIFLPVVHYASDAAVGTLLAQSIYAEDPSAPSSPSSPPSSSSSSQHSSEETVQAECPSTETPTPTPYPPHAAPASQKLEMAGSSTTLAVEVEVSEGRYEIEGGVLRWWYDVSETEAKEVKVVVRRRGGRIWTKEEREREGGAGGGGWEFWRERCGRGGGCTIM